MGSTNNTKMSLAFFQASSQGQLDPRDGALYTYSLWVPDAADWLRVWWANQPNREPYVTEYLAFGLGSITRGIEVRDSE